MKKTLFTLALGIAMMIGVKAQTNPNVSLYDIQYTTTTPYNSPYINQTVNTGGIITAVNNYGFYLQTSNASKWAGLNVYQPSPPSMKIGDSVTFTGLVTEYYNETEMEKISNFVVIDTGLQVLTPPTLVAFNTIQNEQYEGLLVKVNNVTDLRYNVSQAWYVFYDSTITAGINSEDTIDNNLYTYTFTQNKRYNITGVIHFEYANWIEPRNQKDIDSINVTAAGINKYQNNFSDVNMYPNPTNGVFTVSVSVLAGEKNTDIVLTDLAGRIIYKEKMDTQTGSGSLQINTSGFEKGTYFIQIHNAQSNAVKKLIVQ
jgi:hypothetical protein